MPSALRRLELLIFLRNTFFTIHTTSTAGVKRSLGSHLISVYDLLVASGCDSDVCTAGALHSIYGTGVFKKITILATTDNRAEIRTRFGVRAERLAYLFHSCSRKFPNNIETGLLFDRSKRYRLPGVTIEEIQALRLIEAANILDQNTEDFLSKRLPNVYRTWLSQNHLKNHWMASKLTLPGCCGTSCLPAAGENQVNGLRLRAFVCTAADSGSKGFDIYLPVTAASEYEATFLPLANLFDTYIMAESAAKNAVEKPVPLAPNTHKHLIVFTLRGESAMGMPWSPLWMLSRYLPYSCGGRKSNSCFSSKIALEIDIRRFDGDSAAAVRMYERLSSISRSVGQPRLGPPSLSLASIIDSTCRDRTAPNNGAGRIIDSMMSYGYAVISVDDAAAATITRAYNSVLLFHNTISLKDKKHTFERFDGDRYVGWTRDCSREWLQMRVSRKPDSSTGVRLLWPESFPKEHRDNLAAATELLTSVTENIFEEIGLQLKLGSRKYLRDLCAGRGKGRGTVGSSVCRQFVYLDQRPPRQQTESSSVTDSLPAASLAPRFASGSHADMGLLTLSPCSTIPALNLLNPYSHDMTYPEQGLGPNEWVLFAGETLSFLTGGAVQAPIHSVPQIDRLKLKEVCVDGPGSGSGSGSGVLGPPPLRRSMPLFLRADPEMHLLPWRDSTREEVLTAIPAVPEKSTPSSSTPDNLSDLPAILDESSGLLVVEGGLEESYSEDTSEHKDGSLMDLIPKIEDSSHGLLENYSEEKYEEILLNKNTDVSHSKNSNGKTFSEKKSEKNTNSTSSFLSPYAMTCREFTHTHSIGLRPWRLGKGGGDF
jgi:hypothetical protein